MTFLPLDRKTAKQPEHGYFSHLRQQAAFFSFRARASSEKHGEGLVKIGGPILGYM
jgi:hypothetical protein